MKTSMNMIRFGSGVRVLLLVGALMTLEVHGASEVDTKPNLIPFLRYERGKLKGSERDSMESLIEVLSGSGINIDVRDMVEIFSKSNLKSYQAMVFQKIKTGNRKFLATAWTPAKAIACFCRYLAEGAEEREQEDRELETLIKLYEGGVFEAFVPEKMMVTLVQLTDIFTMEKVVDWVKSTKFKSGDLPWFVTLEEVSKRIFDVVTLTHEYKDGKKEKLNCKVIAYDSRDGKTVDMTVQVEEVLETKQGEYPRRSKFQVKVKEPKLDSTGRRYQAWQWLETNRTGYNNEDRVWNAMPKDPLPEPSIFGMISQ